MIEGPLSREGLRRCEATLHESLKTKLISQSLNDRTAVYRIETESGDVFFLRVLTEKRATDFRETEYVGPRYGFPNCEIVENDPPLLLMEPAPGYALSRFMPLVLLPFVYSINKTAFKPAMRQFGEYLGRLHVENQTRTAPLLQSKIYRAANGFSERLHEEMGYKILDLLRTHLQKVRAETLSYGRLHSDPTPHNVFYSDGDVTLIDFSLREGLLMSDVIRAERGLSLMSKRLPYSTERKEEALIDRFREGYRNESPMIDRNRTYYLLRCAMDCYLLDRLLTHRSSKRGAMVARWTDIPVLTDRINDAVSKF